MTVDEPAGMRITLADVHADVTATRADVAQLRSVVERWNAGQEARLRVVERENADTEKRLRTLERDAATKDELAALRGELTAQAAGEAARRPSWASVAVSAGALLLSLVTAAVTIAAR